MRKGGGGGLGGCVPPPPPPPPPTLSGLNPWILVEVPGHPPCPNP